MKGIKKKTEDDLEDDDIIIDDDVIDDDEDENIEVDIGDDDSNDDDDSSKSSNRKFASMRIENKKLAEQLAETTQQIKELQQSQHTPLAPIYGAPPTPDGVPKTEEEWDALAEKDWKKAVDLRSTINAQQLYDKTQAESKASSTLDSAKQKVLAVHPELSDDNSEKSKIFLQILQQNPEYVTHPKGPIFAMRDMEDHMENVLGYKREDIISAESSGAKREASRQHRIKLNSGTGRTDVGNSKKVTLTKDEMEFCKFQGIDPKEYARNKQKLSKAGKGGVQV